MEASRSVAERASTPHGNARFNRQCKKKQERETTVSQKSVKFALLMYKQLTSEQRYTISVLLQKGEKKSDIAKAIGVNPSTITRELRRNSGSRGKYVWETAQRNAVYHKHRQPGNRAVSKELRQEAEKLLREEQWSPEQISGHLKLQGKYISHETIYKMIRKDKRDGGDLYKNCRHRLKHRSRPVGGKRLNIPNRTSIDQRPKEADGKRFGDFEMDTIVGKGNHGAILTIVERNTNMLFMRKLTHGKNAEELAKNVVWLLEPYKQHIKTITTDNGTEFTCHEYITQKLGVKVYFADPYSSWQKGAIENANGLIRQYIPKAAEFSKISHQKVKQVMEKINARPREKLNFLTPNECFYEKII